MFLGACYKQVRALLRLVEWKQMSSNMFEKLPTFLMGKNQPGWPIEGKTGMTFLRQPP